MQVTPVLLVIITSHGWVDITQTYSSYVYSRPYSNYQNQTNFKELHQWTNVLTEVCDSKQTAGKKKNVSVTWRTKYTHLSDNKLHFQIIIHIIDLVSALRY